MVNGRPAGNARAGWSVVVGLLSIVALPLAVAATRWSERYELLHAAVGIPVGLLLGIGAVLLARRGHCPRGDRLRPLHCFLYGRPTAAGGMERPMTPATAMSVST